MVDPRMPTDPAEPPFAAARGLGRLRAEAWDHLWPWRRGVAAPHAALRAAGVSLALAATIAWVLGAAGELRAGALIAWWFGWSVYEVLIRLHAKRYVKDGPWWGRRWRVAGVMDMLCYVGFKNLLIGAALFLALRALGTVVV
ncbi:transcription regulator [Azohydromonas sp. G-1-1-14]|uniref:Transcription regulator n=1 Tax=Azohydromonas caseinilytica TaxID=2728836 RepID=A0A848F5N0_9BURK|nr:transcription regulator [Azohydromonas caseinilytica]